MPADRKIIEFTPKPHECLAYSFTDHDQALIAYVKCCEDLVGRNRKVLLVEIEGKMTVVVLMREQTHRELVGKLSSFMSFYGIQSDLAPDIIQDLNSDKSPPR